MNCTTRVIFPQIKYFFICTQRLINDKSSYKCLAFTFFLLFTNNYNHKIDKFTSLMAFILKLTFTTIKKSLKIVKNSTEAASRQNIRWAQNLICTKVVGKYCSYTAFIKTLPTFNQFLLKTISIMHKPSFRKQGPRPYSQHFIFFVTCVTNNKLEWL